ncbi:imidazole glycerol phosphate synthase subunit hisH [Candidatus Koribacter versatilis Ellin345]|uniref:Imidazole glycerol phosphate synthase subunit HisH n=1 Tax=Koribacter versatilis (strain Ellin345) TaxID=204669 RepID=Q1IKB3_KORVE|nr:imidazole glycerol phosphate synthase subunit HisH [Candidatus Koribacter versatilis]ABF42687.1 imidazole glycerol phosphate synthase subunit hisH [Candidatus Koribacter versatilis Ellin345]
MIAIVDYGAGNLTSVAKALRHLGALVEITADPIAVAAADAVVLPGVGHFASTQTIGQQGLTPAIRDAIASDKPFLGICVGLQWVFAGSAEAPETAGLGCFDATCERFPAGARVPHVGWNQLEITRPSRLLEGVRNDAHVYYTHSYFAPVVPETVATTEYGCDFTAVVERGNTFAVQFHPEKSGENGLTILRNFVRLAC